MTVRFFYCVPQSIPYSPKLADWTREFDGHEATVSFKVCIILVAKIDAAFKAHRKP